MTPETDSPGTMIAEFEGPTDPNPGPMSEESRRRWREYLQLLRGSGGRPRPGGDQPPPHESRG